MNKKTELKMKKQIINGKHTTFHLVNYDWRICDYYLYDLIYFLFEHCGNWKSTLEQLKIKGLGALGGNMMYFRANGPTVVIYEHFTIDDMPENGIKINRTDLIEIIETWQQVDRRSDIDEVILQRDKQHITLIVKFDDKSELRKTFDYRWQDEPYSTTGDHYIDTLREFLYEHRWRAGGMISTLQDETRTDFGINKMYMHIDGPIVTIYNYFDENPSKNAIKISKDLLIKLFETIAENESDYLENIDLERNDNLITITVHYEDNVPSLSRAFTIE